MRKNKNLLFVTVIFASVIGMITESKAQSYYTLDSCRSMALSFNKELQEAQKKVVSARYERKVAKATYFTGIDASVS